MTRRVAILGSTGSVGRQALDVVRALSGVLSVVGLAAGKQTALLAEQVAEFRPRYVATGAPVAVGAFEPAQQLPMEELVAQPDVDLVLVATVGGAGIGPTLAALRAGKPVALANKEVLVVAGEHVIREAQVHRVPILPVDSEHSALWQCLVGERCDQTESMRTNVEAPSDAVPSWRLADAGQWGREAGIARLVLTASGGAFRDRPLSDLANVTAEEACCHPTWKMGPKVTVDCATLMNKGFEIIEAQWLFGVPYDCIDVVLHRQSIVHSLVEFVDGSVKAQVSPPDMRLPIQYALTYPTRQPAPWPRLDLTKLARLDFQELDIARYPCFRLALEAARAESTYPAVLSGADEAAVSAFMAGRIGFLDIPRLVEDALAAHRPVSNPSLDDLLAAEAEGLATASSSVSA